MASARGFWACHADAIMSLAIRKRKDTMLGQEKNPGLTPHVVFAAVMALLVVALAGATLLPKDEGRANPVQAFIQERLSRLAVSGAKDDAPDATAVVTPVSAQMPPGRASWRWPSRWSQPPHLLPGRRSSRWTPYDATITGYNDRSHSRAKIGWRVFIPTVHAWMAHIRSTMGSRW